MARLALQAAGGVIGGIIGGPMGASAGIMIGGWLGSVIDPVRTEGPRLTDLKIQTSTYGAAIPIVYGASRFSGNVIWSTDILENNKESVAGKGGPVQTTYTYSASFAVGLCEGPVTTVRRIWADTKLIYDASASNTGAVEKYPGVVRIYDGSETQLPDSTMESYLGAGDVPAHRGMCYLVFSGLQLADFANRIPSIGAEIVVDGDASCVPTIIPGTTTVGNSGGLIDSRNGALFCAASGNKLLKIDLVSGTVPLEVSTLDATFYGAPYGVDSSGNIYHGTTVGAGGGNIRLVKRDPNTLAVLATSLDVDYSIGGCVLSNLILLARSRVVYDINFRFVIDLSDVFLFNLLYGESPICVDNDSTYWQAYQGVLRRSFDGINVDTYDITPYAGTANPSAIFYDETTDSIYMKFGGLGRIVKWAPKGGFVSYLDGVPLMSTSTYQGDVNYPVNGTLWVGSEHTVAHIDLVNMVILKTIDMTSYEPPYITSYTGCYDKYTHSMTIMTTAGQIKYPLERYTVDTVLLGDVLKALCLKSNLISTDVVTSEVTNLLRGYVISGRTSIRDAMQPLLNAFFIETSETDGILNFIPRGKPSILTIPYEDLGAIEGSSNKGAIRLSETRSQTVDLPSRIDLTHVDPSRSYETNTQHASRSAAAEVGTEDIEAVSTNIVFTATEAAQVADKLLTSLWVGRSTYSFNLPPSYLRVDPTDVVIVETPDVSLQLRIAEVDLGANNVVACKGVADSEDSYISTATGAEADGDDQIIPIALPVSTFLMDIPMLRAADDSLGLCYAFGLREDGSAFLHRSVDALAWSQFGTGSVAPTFGSASTLLADCTSPWVWDETNTVTVSLLHGTLASATKLQVLDWANVALLGDEIIQWRDATLLASGLYRLSGLLRGRRGTEADTSTHAIGERFVVLGEDSGIYRSEMPLTQIAQLSYYKGLPLNGNWDDAVVTTNTFNAESLRCFSPVGIAGARDGSSNLTITWIRRTRWNGEWLDGTDIPLGEETESYDIDILDGTTIKRTLTAVTPTVVYTAANQVTDFGSTQASIDVKIYQRNAIVGRGHAGEATV